MTKLLLTIPALLIATMTDARADWAWGGYGGGPYYSPNRYADNARVPHFSLYPPVYYSYPVPRPYGYSPFAYPGWTPTPHVPEMEQPHTIVNPHLHGEPVRPAELKSPAEAHPTTHKFGSVRPLRIVNPHVGDVIAGEVR